MTRCIVDVNENYTMCGQYSRASDTRDYRESKCFYCRSVFDRRLDLMVERSRKERAE